MHRSLAWALMMIGGSTAFSLFVPVLSAFIAYSIADRPGITPGIIGGLLATSLGSGFLGGLVAGFLAGYVTLALNSYIKLPKNLQGLMPVLVLPLLSTLIVGLAMVYLIGPPMKVVNDAMTSFLKGMQTGSAVVLGLILGAMMAFDMGGPVNKAAYAFSVGLLSSQVYEPMAAVMAAGMTPPLGLALASMFFSLRRRWMTEVRGSARPRESVPLPLIPAWLSSRRLAWGSLAAMWMLVLLFRVSAPGMVPSRRRSRSRRRRCVRYCWR